MENAGADTVTSMWWTTTTLTGRCTPLVEVQSRPLTARETDILPQSTLSLKRYYNIKIPVNQQKIIGTKNNLIKFMLNRFDQVTKRVETAENQWKGWNWRSEGDLMLNGAYFTPSGAGASASYARASSLGAKPSSLISSITSGAGALTCRRGRQC